MLFYLAYLIALNIVGIYLHSKIVLTVTTVSQILRYNIIDSTKMFYTDYTYEYEHNIVVSGYLYYYLFWSTYIQKIY